jgi:hypothetical protein
MNWLPSTRAWHNRMANLLARRNEVSKIGGSERLGTLAKTGLAALLCGTFVVDAVGQGRRYIPPSIFKKRPRVEIYKTERKQKPPPPPKTRKTRSTWHDDLKTTSKAKRAPEAKKQRLPSELHAKVDVCRRRGYEDGYENGFEKGDRNRAANETIDYRNDCDYQAATGNYVTAFGPQEAYEEGFRAGFEQGYPTGREGREYANVDATTGTARTSRKGQDATSLIARQALHGWQDYAEKYGYNDGVESATFYRDSFRAMPPPGSHPTYASAVNGWTEGLCDKAAYQTRYRRYFVLGYATIVAQRTEKAKQAESARKAGKSRKTS